MHAKVKRTGFTLVELLIVMGIIVLAAAILVPVTLSLSERNQVPKAASMIEGAMQLAKSRAIASKRPNGFRLVALEARQRTTVGNIGFAWMNEIQFIEDPGDFNDAWVWGVASISGVVTVPQPWWGRNSPAPAINRPVPNPGEPSNGIDTIQVAPGPFSFTALADTAGTVVNLSGANAIPRNRCLFGPISNLANSSPATNQWTGGSGGNYDGQRLRFSFVDNQNVNLNTASITNLQGQVQPGDRVELLDTGEIYEVQFVSAVQAAGPRVTGLNVPISGNANPINVPVIVLDRPLTRDIPPTFNGRPNYRVIRQPRPVAGVQPIKLPQDVVVDLTPPRQAGLNTDTTNTIYMSGVSLGVTTPGITGLTPVQPPPAGFPVVPLVAPPFVDIMFSPSGEVIPTSQQFGNLNTGPYSSFSVGTSDVIALWVHSHGSADLWFNRQLSAAQGNADNQALVTVHARTGIIGSYPVSRSADPLEYVRTGKGRMSADTGP
jgi:prepilin-type N-terminal cleavage/methylation domain-containing protein